MKYMKKTAVLFSGLCLVFVSFAAKADSLRFKTGNSDWGPNKLVLTSGSSTTTISAFCMDVLYHVNGKETWGVDVINGMDLASNALTSGSLIQYEQEAYIAAPTPAAAVWARMRRSCRRLCGRYSIPSM